MKPLLLLGWIGFSTLVLEIFAMRIIAPYHGLGLTSWTTVIGCFLALMGLGYQLGSRAGNQAKHLVMILLGLGSWFVLLPWMEMPLGFYLKTQGGSEILKLFFMVIGLFAWPAFGLAYLSAVLFKHWIERVQQAGLVLGILTMGNLSGAIFTGSGGIQLFGHHFLLFLIGLIFFAFSFTYQPDLKRILLVTLPCLLLLGFFKYYTPAYNLLDYDSSYNRIWIYNVYTHGLKKVARRMQINDEISSEVIPHTPEPVENYSLFYEALSRYFSPASQSTALLGGGGYAYPRYFLKAFPTQHIEVIEIDPLVTQLAHEHFDVPISPYLTTIHQDARLFLKRQARQYAVLINEAYHSNQPVYQLLTLEAFQEAANCLKPRGVIVVFLMTAIEGEDGRLLRLIYNTMQKVFPQVEIFPLLDVEKGETIQPTLLIGLKQSQMIKANPKQGFLSQRWLKPVAQEAFILTDDYAPISALIRQNPFPWPGLNLKFYHHMQQQR